MRRSSRPVLWIDASAGASGDMLLGALVDLGVPLPVVRRTVASTGLEGWTMRRSKVVRGTLAATRVEVALKGAARDHHHVLAPGVHHPRRPGHGRTWRDIRRILAGAVLDPSVREIARRTFQRLFEAEALVHGLEIRRVHLHEAGATDAVADIVGVAAALVHLGRPRVVVSPPTTGSGTVTCAHGELPVPTPATLRLLRGVPLSGIDAPGERLTPTGAALLTTIAESWGGLPELVPTAVGHGAGSRDTPDRPNVLRAVLGEESRSEPSDGHGEVVVLECAIDDATPQHVAHACERLLEAGAVDVVTTPVLMKKGRAGHHLTVLARPVDLEAVAATLLRETTTLGVRYRRERRIELARAVRRVTTPFGRIRVKFGRIGGREVHIAPEYDDCAALARRHGVSLRDVQLAALAAHRATRGSR